MAHDASTRLQKYLRVLTVLGDDAPPATVTDLARRVGLSRSSVYGVLEALAESGMVEFDARERRYRLGKAVLGLGLAVFEAMPVRHLAVRYLYELRDVTGETATLITVIGHRGVAVDQAVSRQEPRRVSLIGRPSSLFDHADGAVAGMWAAFNPAFAALLDQLEGGTADETRRRVLHHAATIRADGYAIDEDGPIHTNILAMPVFRDEGAADFAVAVVGPGQRWTRARMDEVLPDCLQIVRQLSAQLSSFNGSLY